MAQSKSLWHTDMPMKNMVMFHSFLQAPWRSRPCAAAGLAWCFFGLVSRWEKMSPETTNFTVKYGGFPAFRFQCSLKPIQWNPMDMDKPHMEWLLGKFMGQPGLQPQISVFPDPYINSGNEFNNEKWWYSNTTGKSFFYFSWVRSWSIFVLWAPWTHPNTKHRSNGG